MIVTVAVVILCVILLLVLTAVYQKNTNAFCISIKCLSGKTAIVTGGTAGMGLEIAKDFAQRGAKVIIVCPFTEEGENARELIVKKTGNINVVFQHLDLSSLKSVREFADNILKTEERLDILVNNAGVGLAGDFFSDDGLNFTLQVNYFGHFLLTLLLLPLLMKTAPSRVVNTASILHYLGRFDEENLNTTGYYWVWPSLRNYGISKYCNIPFSREFTRRVKGSGVVMNTVDPGLVGTGIFNTSCGNLVGGTITLLAKYLYKTPREGAQTAIHCSVDDSAAEVSGELFKNCRQIRGMSSAYDDELARKLWDKSVELVKLSDKEIESCFQPLKQ